MGDCIKVYDADEVFVSFGPVLFESGLATENFLRIANDGPLTEDVSGLDGEVTVSRLRDRRAMLYITLQQTSRHNDELSVLANFVKKAKAMAGAIHPFGVKDPNGRSIYAAANCWVKEEPEVTFYLKPTERVWGIRIAHLGRLDGGNF